ncbi:hypothetical protein EJ02DRAFT_456712 [Clathrospora elynae]|uniref:Uncharacterized protein n=1 Tax=Clathrospora elynae TaxID=706981 RepID=A0A6A5SIM8_9PLEO|nr:hypothetical protein EJ02DRAFT_456712 [Clathrospora elynae]
MSQPSTPFKDAAADPFLPSVEHEQQLSQADFKELSGSNTSHRPVFLSNESELLHELDFIYDNASLAHIDSSNPSTNSTPEFSSYSFNQHSPAYPNPGPNSPHPYALDLQQNYQKTAPQQALSHRPLPTRSHTNNFFPHSAQPPQTYGRRRSLSYGDVDRVAAANAIPNPTFIRLQAPRSRSITPEEKRRSGPYPQHGRSASQGPGPRGRPMKPTSTPYAVHGSLLVGGMLPTPIGTPLNEMMQMEDLHYCCAANFTRQENGLSLTGYAEMPMIRHMMRPEEIAHSMQIIEIGAMVVSNTKAPRSKLDSSSDEQTPKDALTRTMKKLEDIKRYLENMEGDNAEALSGCKKIRDALTEMWEDMRVKQTGEISMRDEVMEEDWDAPSKVFEERDCDMFGGGMWEGDNELTAMLMKENGRIDEEVDEE